SVAEAYLYVRSMRCRACSQGPINPNDELTRREAAEGGWTLQTTCAACKAGTVFHFRIDPLPTREEAQSDRINQTSRPSEAIDLLGWLSLFQSILTASEQQLDRQVARQLAWEAAQCLDEAMKFYEPEEELPSATAFFNDESRQRFRDHPQQFAKSKWRQRR